MEIGSEFTILNGARRIGKIAKTNKITSALGKFVSDQDYLLSSDSGISKGKHSPPIKMFL